MCEYFASDGCGGSLGYTDSTRASVRASVPEEVGARMGSAVCVPAPLCRGAAGGGGGGEGEGGSRAGDGFAIGALVADAEGF